MSRGAWRTLDSAVTCQEACSETASAVASPAPRTDDTAAAGQISVQPNSDCRVTARRHNGGTKRRVSGPPLPASFIVGGMTPFQPGNQGAADRDDRARRQTEHKANLSILAQSPHVEALQHMIECPHCAEQLFALMVDALAETRPELRAALRRSA